MAQQTPTYTSNLERGHSRECQNLSVAYYPDLQTDIGSLASQVQESLYGLMDKDVRMADTVTAILDHTHLGRESYQSLLANLTHIQSLLRSSKLTEEERVAFWAPIAECYVRVQTILEERIIPLENRELIQLNKTVNLPVNVQLDCRFRRGFYISTDLPLFKYALERINHDNPSHRYREPLASMSFSDGYLDQLPAKVVNRLQSGKMELPLKVVSEGSGMITIVEIDIPAFLAMSASDAE